MQEQDLQFVRCEAGNAHAIRDLVPKLCVRTSMNEFNVRTAMHDFHFTVLPLLGCGWWTSSHVVGKWSCHHLVLAWEFMCAMSDCKS